ARAHKQYRTKNLGAYLRRTVGQPGDPGQLLESDQRNRMRLGRDQFDFSSETEAQLRGERTAEIEAIENIGAEAVRDIDEQDRSRLLAELQSLLRQQRKQAARAVLLQLVSASASDIELRRVLGDACTLTEAREVLAA